MPPAPPRRAPALLTWLAFRSRTIFSLCRSLGLLCFLLSAFCFFPGCAPLPQFTAPTVTQRAVATAAPPPAPAPRIEWKHTNPAQIQCYEIHTTTNLTLPLEAWPLLATTTNFTHPLPIDAPQKFFIVRAIGTNGLPSGWATR